MKIKILNISKRYIRLLFYKCSPKFRFILRRIYFLPIDLLSKNDKNLPPRGLIYTGLKDFEKYGKAWCVFFIDHGLKQEHSFLDIGSGIGRIALGLKDFLLGTYKGFEAMKVGVKWCQKNISSKYKNFEFKLVKLYNDLYNGNGMDASNYQFEYKINSFDFAASISVFTHMIDKELENYLIQTNKVLKVGGIFVSTFFICDEKYEGISVSKASSFVFPYTYENYLLMDKKVKSANVCFKREYLFSIIEKSGFKVIKEIKGFWSGAPKLHDLAFQDVLVLQKIKLC